MNWLEFWSNIIGHLAWPVAVMSLGFFFRAEIRTKLQRLTTIEAAGAKAAFSEEAKELAAETKEVIAANPPAAIPANAATPSAAAIETEETAPAKSTPFNLPPSGKSSADDLRGHWKSVLIPSTRPVVYGGGPPMRPAAVVLDMWTRIENALAVLVNREREDNPVAEVIFGLGPHSWISYLEEKGVLTNQTSHVLRRLYALRNSVAHEQSFEPDMKDALNYLSSAEEILEVLHRATRVTE